MKLLRLTLLLFISSLSTLYAQLEDSCKLNMGMNLAGIVDYSRELPFSNLMKMSREWYTKGENDPNYTWDTGNAEALTYDQSGYPTHIPQTLPGVSLPQQVATVWDGTDSWPIGKYTLIWEGSGDFDFWGDLSNLVKVNDNRYEFDYLDPLGGILQITMTYSDISDPVNNMRLLLPNTELTYQIHPFNPEWLQELSSFKTLRFMDWGHTNFWGQPDPYTWDFPDLVDWDERTQVDYYTYVGNKGVPYELITQLVNQLQIDAWVCVPHRASDQYITEMANLFRDQCDPDRHLYIEYSNENWNWIFGQAQWLNKYGAVDQGVSWPEGIVPYIQNAFDLWTSSFTGQLDRITRVAAIQTSWLDVSERIVYNLNANTVDAVSPTFYFSYDDSSETILDNLGQNATVTDIAYHARLGMTPNLNWIKDIKTISDSLDAELLFYEGGQHMTPTPFGILPTYEQALTEIHRDDVMYELYNDWLDSIRTINTTDKPMLLMHFSFISPLSAQYGSWGILETMNQNLVDIPAPKYRSVIENNGCSTIVLDSKEKVERQVQNIKLYPNPTNGQFKIGGINPPFSISIHDVTGTLVQEKSITQNADTNINISDLSSGIYFIEIRMPHTNLVQMEKVILH